jgi:hypothetical protein
MVIFEINSFVREAMSFAGSQNTGSRVALQWNTAGAGGGVGTGVFPHTPMMILDFGGQTRTRSDIFGTVLWQPDFNSHKLISFPPCGQFGTNTATLQSA